MKQVTITEKEFDEVVAQVMGETTDDKRLEGLMMQMTASLMGVKFAQDMRKKLFKESEGDA